MRGNILCGGIAKPLIFIIGVTERQVKVEMHTGLPTIFSSAGMCIFLLDGCTIACKR